MAYRSVVGVDGLDPPLLDVVVSHRARDHGDPPQVLEVTFLEKNRVSEVSGRIVDSNLHQQLSSEGVNMR